MPTLDADTARGIAFDYYDQELYTMVESEIVHTTRWGIIYRTVYIDKADGKYYAFEFEDGATELQDYSDFDNGDITPYEVQPVQVTVTEFHKV